MKKVISILGVVLISFFTIMLVYNNQVYAEGGSVNSDITTDTGKIIIPFEKKWENVSVEEQPDSVTIKLYKYLGETFDESTAILVESVEVTKENDWKYEFDISNEALFDSQNNAYKFKVVEKVIDGYEEVAHQDPAVEFKPPLVSDDWNRVTPCDKINISTSGNLKTVLVAKMTGNQGNIFIVWTVDPLTESERKLIYDVTSGINGFGNPKYEKYVYISGTTGEYYNNGLKVLEVDTDHINFYGGTSVWSLFATGLYYKSSTEANASSITNTIKTTSIVVEKKWEDHNNILGLRPSEVIVQLLKNGVVIDEVKLSESNNWKHEFTELREYTDGKLNNYTVRELNINGYVPSEKVEGNKITITNTHEVKSTVVNVSKVWNNVDQIKKLPGVIVGLYYKVDENDTFHEIARTTLTEDINWSYTFTHGEDIITGKILDILPSDYIYEVKEIGFDVDSSEEDFYQEFFMTEYQHTGNDWTITNTCTASYILPETGSSGGLILSIVVSTLFGTPITYLIYSFIRKAI